MKGKKTGGRSKGTPNKDNPLKAYLRAHSEEYFTPKPQVDSSGAPIILPDGRTLADSSGSPLILSAFDLDMLALEPSDRISAELRLLEFHTPKLKAVDLEMNVQGPITIEGTLRSLAEEEDEEEEDEDED